MKTVVKDSKLIKRREGLIPICSYCKKVRDDSGHEYGEGSWERREDFMYTETDREFTHGVCPECVEIAFPHVACDRQAYV